MELVSLKIKSYELPSDEISSAESNLYVLISILQLFTYKTHGVRTQKKQSETTRYLIKYIMYEIAWDARKLINRRQKIRNISL
jgi:hypothetical protein